MERSQTRKKRARNIMASPSFASTSELQAARAVNSTLARVLPGMRKLGRNNSSINAIRKAKKGSKAQLIDRNLKRRVELQERDAHRIKKRQRKREKARLRQHRVEQEVLEKEARLNVLKKHKENAQLTSSEKRYLNWLTRRNVENAKSWGVPDNIREEAMELQAYFLDDQSKRVKQRRKNKNGGSSFQDFGSPSANSNQKGNFSGLTPGLAPVGPSDEEESSEEESSEDNY